jgi:hypothetical protein
MAGGDLGDPRADAYGLAAAYILPFRGTSRRSRNRISMSKSRIRKFI